MDITNSIQLAIAIIMGLTAIITLIYAILFYLSLKKNTDSNLTNSFSNLVKEDMKIRNLIYSYRDKIDNAKGERKIELIEEGDLLLFTFYDYVAILYFERKISEDVFFNYFGSKIGGVYNNFMESTLFEHSDDRFKSYPNLSLLFNSFSLSIREKPKGFEEEELHHY